MQQLYENMKNNFIRSFIIIITFFEKMNPMSNDMYE
jgi:hypothetical protein